MFVSGRTGLNGRFRVIKAGSDVINIAAVQGWFLLVGAKMDNRQV